MNINDVNYAFNYLSETKNKIKQSLRAKGLSVSDSDTFRSYSEKIDSLITINENNTDEDFITFVDYAGLPIECWSKSNVSIKTEDDLPIPPEHDFLLFQEWNYTLDEIKNRKSKATIGATYELKDDYSLFIDISIEERKKVTISLAKKSGSNYHYYIDYGDGTTDSGSQENSSFNIVKQYTDSGKYRIKIKIQYATFYLSKIYLDNLNTTTGSASKYSGYCSFIDNIYFGKNITGINNNCFIGCCNLKRITLSNYINYLGQYFLSYAYNIDFLSLPKSISSLNQYFLYYSNVKKITLSNYTKNFAGYVFFYCYTLNNITISEEIENFSSYMFGYCYSLKSFYFPNSLASIGTFCFSTCVSLKNLNNFENLSISIIPNYCFQNDYSLESVIIPETVTSIGTYAFNQCVYLKKIKFLSSTPPAASATNWYSGIPTDCVIYVPAGSLESYTSATNFPPSETYTYIEY